MSKNFIITGDANVSYLLRTKSDKQFIISISLLFVFFIWIFSNWIIGLSFGALYFLIQHSRSVSRNKFYVSEIKRNENLIEINYFELEDKKYVSGDLKDFRFTKGNTFNTKNTTFYLSIFYKGAFLLKQFEMGGWNESKFEDVINNINN